MTRWLHRECDERLTNQEQVVVRLLRRIDMLTGTLRQSTADIISERAHADRLAKALQDVLEAVDAGGVARTDAEWRAAINALASHDDRRADA